ncbi:MAG: 2-oxoacid:acceptor oxidoreductase subunit alpha [Gammaproteobacteria bacterium]|nr:2-oxoacid:acceptor oxidoreductase subunit alpha [Gammaproteobacteria bacterium]
MKRTGINDLVVKFANVNGSGSASANTMFGKAVFRMGIPVSPKNYFPSNIQGLPTWYEVRVSERGYTGRRAGVDIMVAMNPQTSARDVASILPGGYLFYDSTKQLDSTLRREEINYIGIPLTEMCIREYSNPRHRTLFKNIIYVGALARLLDMEFGVFEQLIAEQFTNKPKLIEPNLNALKMGWDYAGEHFDCPLGLRLERRDLVGDQILMTGNDAAGLGAVYAGATVTAWYPITPSTSLIDAFTRYSEQLRPTDDEGKKRVAVIQAEDELAAIGVVVGANWNGARAFTATSGPGLSLMAEFLGLAYFAEIPVVLFDVQRSGPSTGMPTRTQASDLLTAAYASHGDTKQVLLIPSSPAECFELSATAFDLAERLQTPVIVMSDLDLGMNDWLSPPLAWESQRRMDRGKMLGAEALDELTRYGRYLDVDGDGIGYRTLPGTHPTKGAFFTRGSGHDRYAGYTEDPDKYVDNMERLLRKFATAAALVPTAEINLVKGAGKTGLIYYGSAAPAVLEGVDLLAEQGALIDTLRLRGFPFGEEVEAFIESHEAVIVLDMNRDGQMRSLLINELNVDPARLLSITCYDGMPVTAAELVTRISEEVGATTTIRARLAEVGK